MTKKTSKKNDNNTFSFKLLLLIGIISFFVSSIVIYNTNHFGAGLIAGFITIIILFIGILFINR